MYVASRTRFDKVNRIDGSYHLVLLCKNETGYKNLIKLVSAGFIDGFYNKPRIDHALLEEHHEGLSAFLPALRAKSRRRCWRATTKRQRPLPNITKIYLARAIIILKYKTTAAGTAPGAAYAGAAFTGDRHPPGCHKRRHYLRKEDSRMQHILICIQTNKTVKRRRCAGIWHR